MMTHHLIIIYPNGVHNINLIRKALTIELKGEISDERTMNLTQDEAFGFVMQLYWDAKHLDVQSIQNKLVKSGWKYPHEKKTLIVINWKSPNEKFSQELMGKGAPLKCYLRYIAYTGDIIPYGKRVITEEECSVWKSTLHSPDKFDDNLRLFPLFFQDSTNQWTREVSWRVFLPIIVDWLSKHDKELNELYQEGNKIWTDWRWSHLGVLEKYRKKNKDKMRENGVYWCGVWMSIPPETEDEWKHWISLSNKGQSGSSRDSLWSHPATFVREDLKMRNSADYVMSWKTDGLHGILEIGDEDWKILNEIGEVQASGKIGLKGRRFIKTRWEGEWIPERKEFIAFDIPLEDSIKWNERVEIGEVYWTKKERRDYLWKAKSISDDLSLLWKPSVPAKDIETYLTNVYKIGYELDGLIFTPVNVNWVDLGKTFYSKILKWKPLLQQTIDVYLYDGRIWLKEFNKKGYIPKEFKCPLTYHKGYYPKEWRHSLLSDSQPIIYWNDGTTIHDHNNEIWEICWGKSINKNSASNRWMAVRRRESNKEVLLKGIGANGICDGRFVGPNAWRTMRSIEEYLRVPVTIMNLEEWAKNSFV